MSVVKVIELLAEGSTMEDAVESALAEASKTIRNIKSVYIEDIQALVENNKVSKYRLNVKVSFVVGT
ncbi:MAG: dodecin domain-containing protein [Nitrospiraceae bacterium]|nr:MAG: dodecin domain-containing protein [Nitrospiraceae bacterium]